MGSETVMVTIGMSIQKISVVDRLMLTLYDLDHC